MGQESPIPQTQYAKALSISSDYAAANCNSERFAAYLPAIAHSIAPAMANKKSGFSEKNLTTGQGLNCPLYGSVDDKKANSLFKYLPLTFRFVRSPTELRAQSGKQENKTAEVNKC